MFARSLTPKPISPPQIRKASTLSGKRVLITGGSRGIGAAIAIRFANDGAFITLIGRNRASLVDIASSLRQEPTDERHWSHVHSVRVGNVSEKEFWDELVRDKELVERGGWDVLVNAAGVAHYSLLMATKAELVREIVDTNLMGTIWGCKAVVKGMMRKKSGCIINVASLLGVKGGHGSTVYAASKAGIIGLTRSLAAEVGPLGIRVNAIIPGYIETQMTEAMTPEAREKALDSIPLKRFGHVKEVAEAAAFLANNEYASNCTLNLDGGLSAT